MKKKKWTAESIAALKGERKFACLTAYDFPMARIMDEVGIPLILKSFPTELEKNAFIFTGHRGANDM